MRNWKLIHAGGAIKINFAYPGGSAVVIQNCA
jgi:hypothetical protein